jgi:hypothetical protein
MFKEGFLPGSLQPYQKSAMRITLDALPEEEIPIFGDDIPPLPLFTPSLIFVPPPPPPPDSDEDAMESAPLPPPPPLPLPVYLPKPPRLVSKPGERILIEERLQEKEANINWLLNQWQTSIPLKEKVRAVLNKQQWFYVRELVDNPHFREVLDKLASVD